MLILMTKDHAISLAKFLNGRFASGVEAEGHGFKVTQFSKELKIKRSTLLNLMDERKPVEGLDSDILMALWNAYGADVMNALQGDGEIVRRRKEEKEQKKNRAG